MNFASELSADGVTERLFDLTVAGEVVPAVLWTPEAAEGSRPILLMGHGGSQHKTMPRLAASAKRYAKVFGYAVAAIDAPDHGARVAPEDAERIAEQARKRFVAGAALSGDTIRTMMESAVRVKAEWQATLDAVQSLSFVGADHPVGYSGLSLGAHLGIPFVSADRRISAAVLGLAGLAGDAPLLAQYVRDMAAPVTFVVQWDDELVPRAASLALFDAIGSTEKTLHANRGGHLEVPPYERASWEAFFVRHLGEAADA